MNDSKSRVLSWGLAASLWIGLCAQSPAASTQFDFDAPGFTPTFGPGSLSFYGVTTAADVEYGTASSFGLPAMPGGDAGVMRFPPFAFNQGLFLETGAPPNGGGSYINQYTMIWDLFLPDASTKWFSFFNTYDQNGNDGDLFVNPSNAGIGVSGVYDGSVTSTQWHRIAACFDLTTAALSKYIDGVPVGTQTLSGVDDRWCLYSANDVGRGVLLFTDNDGDVSGGYVGSFYFTDRTMSSSEIAALGAPNASGIVPEPSSLAVLVVGGISGWLSRRRKRRSGKTG